MQSCKNVDLNLILIAATTNGLTFRIVNSLQCNGILGGTLDLAYQCDIKGPREKSQFYVFHLLIKVWFLPFNIHV